MGDLIDEYFQSHLSLSKEDANELHTRYYKDYGLAIEGLVRHHKIDPLEYNRKVDDALPLDSVLAPNPDLRKFLEDIDTEKVKLWLFTNAYITHGKRVVKLLDIDDIFEGITYCDYGARPLLCKPSPDMFKKAMREANVRNVQDCFFVGRSPISLHLSRRMLTFTIRRLGHKCCRGQKVRLDLCSSGRARRSSSTSTRRHSSDSRPRATSRSVPGFLQELMRTTPGRIGVVYERLMS